MNAIQSQINEIQNVMNGITEKIGKIDEKLTIIGKDEAERRGIERDLQDQIKYREMQVALARCEDDLKLLEEQGGKFDEDTIKREVRKYQSEESELVDKVHKKKGVIYVLTQLL